MAVVAKIGGCGGCGVQKDAAAHRNAVHTAPADATLAARNRIRARFRCYKTYGSQRHHTVLQATRSQNSPPTELDVHVICRHVSSGQKILKLESSVRCFWEKIQKAPNFRVLGSAEKGRLISHPIWAPTSVFWSKYLAVSCVLVKTFGRTRVQPKRHSGLE